MTRKGMFSLVSKQIFIECVTVLAWIIIYMNNRGSSALMEGVTSM
jgi:hypothetical protein